MAQRAWMSWSSGKDSAFALHVARTELGLDVRALLTTVTAPYDRVSMHGVRRALLEAQAKALGIALVVAEIPSPCANEVYDRRMAQVMEGATRDGIEAIVFGDLFLEDVRSYREKQLAPIGIAPCFPLWGRATDRLARQMLAAGIEARITCLDPRQLPRALAGRVWDEALLAALPRGVDPCGENGEMHTFVTNGPGFARPVPVRVGETVERDGFLFTDLVEGPSSTPSP